MILQLLLFLWLNSLKLIETVCSCYFKGRKPRPDPGVDIGEKDVSVVIVIDVVVVCDEDVVVDL